MIQLAFLFRSVWGLRSRPRLAVRYPRANNLQNRLFNLSGSHSGGIEISRIRSLQQRRFAAIPVAVVAFGKLSRQLFVMLRGRFTGAPPYSLGRIGIEKYFD